MLPHLLKMSIPTIVLATAIVAFASPAKAQPEPPTVSSEATSVEAPAEAPLEVGLGVRPQDEVWMISTRHLAYRGGELDVYRLGAQQWNSTTLDQLHRSLNRGAAIHIYVHGNRMGFQRAADRGRLYYDQLSDEEQPPMQFIIWSWPSGQMKGALRDVRQKALRADFEAQLLADFLTTLPRQANLTLLGYSYGARVISGALADVAQSARTCPPAQTVFLAPAVDVNWLGPGQLQGDAWLSMKRLMILFNPRDPALKRFHHTDRCYRPTALGFAGPWWRDQAPGEIDCENVAGWIGKSHDERIYLGTPYLMSRMRGFLRQPFGIGPNALSDVRP